MSLEQAQELYDFLKGKTPEGFQLNEQPQLSSEMAFSIIYVLQEKFNLIPDHFERCEKCDEVFDMECGGDHFDDPGINLCSSCVSHVFWRWAKGEEENMENAVKEWHKVHSCSDSMQDRNSASLSNTNQKVTE